jgi:hypothetical protein
MGAYSGTKGLGARSSQNFAKLFGRANRVGPVLRRWLSCCGRKLSKEIETQGERGLAKTVNGESLGALHLNPRTPDEIHGGWSEGLDGLDVSNRRKN